jgi:hypothetical protein
LPGAALLDEDFDHRLSGLIPWLARQNYEVDDITYREVREAAQAARFPAAQIGSARIWHYHREHTAKIAAALKLRRRPVAA